MTARRALPLLARGLLVALAVSAGCRLPPPAVRPAGPVDLARALAQLPEGAEAVELEVEGASVGGVFVPAGPGAPVMLHFLGSAASAGDALPRPMFGELASRGVASLAVDYRGVGLSGGSRSVRHLTPDARAMWDEALRRTGGDPRRVLVRATSLGGLAAASLLESGARPRALVLVAPVNPTTATRRLARELYGPLGSGLARLLYGPIPAAPPARALAESGVPALVIASADDFFLDERERTELRETVARHGGRWVEYAGGHLSLAVAGNALAPEELDFLDAELPPDTDPTRVATVLASLPPEVSARFPPGSEAEDRLHFLARWARRSADPEALAAGALACDDAHVARAMLARPQWREARVGPARPGERERTLTWVDEHIDARRLSFDDRVASLSLDDPAGPLPFDLLSSMLRAYDLGVVHPVLVPEVIAWMADEAHDGGELPPYAFTYATGRWKEELRIDFQKTWRSLRERGLEARDARRQLARLLLELNGWPDRVRAGPDGEPVLEVFQEKQWTELDLDSEGEADRESEPLLDRWRFQRGYSITSVR